MVATKAKVELQVTEAVMSCVVPSPKVPVAVNCCRAPTAIAGLAGLILIEVRGAEVTSSEVVPLTEPFLP